MLKSSFFQDIVEIVVAINAASSGVGRQLQQALRGFEAISLEQDYLHRLVPLSKGASSG